MHLCTYGKEKAACIYRTHTDTHTLGKISLPQSDGRHCIHIPPPFVARMPSSTVTNICQCVYDRSLRWWS